MLVAIHSTPPSIRMSLQRSKSHCRTNKIWLGTFLSRSHISTQCGLLPFNNYPPAKGCTASLGLGMFCARCSPVGIHFGILTTLTASMEKKKQCNMPAKTTSHLRSWLTLLLLPSHNPVHRKPWLLRITWRTSFETYKFYLTIDQYLPTKFFLLDEHLSLEESPPWWTAQSRGEPALGHLRWKRKM